MSISLHIGRQGRGASDVHCWASCMKSVLILLSFLGIAPGSHAVETNLTAFRVLQYPVWEVEAAVTTCHARIQAERPAEQWEQRSHGGHTSGYWSLTWTGYFRLLPREQWPKTGVVPNAELHFGTNTILCFNAEVYVTNVAPRRTAVEVRTREQTDRDKGQGDTASRLMDGIVAILTKHE